MYVGVSTLNPRWRASGFSLITCTIKFPMSATGRGRVLGSKALQLNNSSLRITPAPPAWPIALYRFCHIAANTGRLQAIGQDDSSLVLRQSFICHAKDSYASTVLSVVNRSVPSGEHLGTGCSLTSLDFAAPICHVGKHNYELVSSLSPQICPHECRMQ